MPKRVVPVFVETAPVGAQLVDVQVGHAYYDALAATGSDTAQETLASDGPTAERTVCILVARVFAGV